MFAFLKSLVEIWKIIPYLVPISKGVSQKFSIFVLCNCKFFLRKFLLFAFSFFESKTLKNWANGVSHKHSNREIKLLKLQKKLDNHNFCLLFIGPFIGICKTYQKIFSIGKKIWEIFDCTTFLKNLWLFKFWLPKMNILELQLAII